MGGEKLKLFFYTLRVSFALLILGCGVLFINIPNVFAQTATSEETDPVINAEENFVLGEDTEGVMPSGPTMGTVVRMVLTLALAAVAIYGVIFIIKRASRRSDVKDPFLKILASTHLGSNRYAHVVAVGSKAWLVGSSDGGVNLISEIEDKDILNALFVEDSRKSAEVPGRFPDFRNILRRLGTPVDSGTAGPENIRKRRERLRGL